MYKISVNGVIIFDDYGRMHLEKEIRVNQSLLDLKIYNYQKIF